MTREPLEICQSASRTAGFVPIVEDDSAVATSLVWLLQNEGFATSVAGDAPSGLAAYERDRPDCVLLDLAQPSRFGRPGSLAERRGTMAEVS